MQQKYRRHGQKYRRFSPVPKIQEELAVFTGNTGVRARPAIDHKASPSQEINALGNVHPILFSICEFGHSDKCLMIGPIIGKLLTLFIDK